MFFGVAFGPIVGFIAGALGNVMADLLSGYGFLALVGSRKWHHGIGARSDLSGYHQLPQSGSDIIKAESMVVVGSFCWEWG